VAEKRYVQQNAEGCWDVLREGDRRTNSHLATRQKALTRARAIVRKAGGGEVFVVNEDGKVLEHKAVRRRKARPRTQITKLA
jgi:Uncharacterized protein conserved in bacteria (DUF2188)